MTQLATDAFQRADENPLSGGGNWIMPSSNAIAIKLSSNQVTSTGAISNYCLSYYQNVAWPNNQYSEITVGGQTSTTNIFNYQWPGVRMSSGGSGYFGLVESTSSGSTHLYIQKRALSAAFNLVGPFSYPVATGDVVRIEVINTIITLKVRGVPVLSVTDSTLVGGFAGIGFFISNLTFGESIFNWSGGDFLTPSPVQLSGVMW